MKLISCYDGGVFLQVAVMYGGVGGEREISLVSGRRMAAALRERGHTVWEMSIDTALPCADALDCARRADALLLGFHGGAGEDGTLQAFLAHEGILHFAGSEAGPSHLAMDKREAKRCVAACGVPVAASFIWEGEKSTLPPFLPLVIKPICGGSSIGLRVVRSLSEWQAASVSAGEMCEGYLPGREYSVAILEGRALPPVLIEPVAGEYDFAHKYTVGATREICPAPLTSQQRVRLQNTALLAYTALGLRDFARIDLREDATGVPVFLEANTLPGMTETSLFPLAAATAGCAFPMLCERLALIAAARKRKEHVLPIDNPLYRGYNEGDGKS